MTRSSEEEIVDLILCFLGWGADDVTGRYHVLRFLRICRGETMPTFDDFCANIQRAS